MKKLLLYLAACFAALTAAAQSDVDTRIPVTSFQDDNTYVVIIANENYKHEDKVVYAHNDGETFKVYCEKTLGIPDSKIKAVFDATLNETNYALDWLEKVLQVNNGNARAIIYYSGHGIPDEKTHEGYLLPVDAYSRYTQSAMSMKSLYSRLALMPTDNIIVFIDACFSGIKRDGKALNQARGVAIKAKKEVVGRNTVVISAAQGDETAYPYEQKEHGLFTYCLLSKIQECGGYINLGELYDNLQQRVRTLSVEVNEKEQNPSAVYSIGNESWRNLLFSSQKAEKYETRTLRQVRKEVPKEKKEEIDKNAATPTKIYTKPTAKIVFQCNNNEISSNDKNLIFSQIKESLLRTKRLNLHEEGNVDYTINVYLYSIKRRSESLRYPASNGSNTMYWTNVLYNLSLIENKSQNILENVNYEKMGNSLDDFEKAKESAMNSILYGGHIKFIESCFPLRAEIVRVLSETKSKIKEVAINVGSDHALEKGQKFSINKRTIFDGDEVLVEIGAATLKEVNGKNISTCTINSGGDKLKKLMIDGETIILKSRAKRGLWGDD